MSHASRFLRGAGTLGTGLRRILETKALWPWALVPSFIFLGLEALFLWVAVKYVAPWVEDQVAGAGNWREWAATGLAAVAVLVSAVVGWLLAAFLTPPLSAPALERIVRQTELTLGIPAREELGLWGEFWCGVRAWLLAACLVLPIMLLLTVVDVFVPGAAFVTVPLKLFVSALGLAWGLLDYPLTLRGVGARERLRFMRQQLPEVAGFGMAFSALFWLPCCGVVLLPVGVIAATLLVSRAAVHIAGSHPERRVR